MSLFKVEDPIVGGGGGSPSSPQRVQVWANNISYSDGQIVVFNGSQYVASGSPGAGLVPAIEYNMPQNPGSPKWLLAARGRSLPEAYDDAKTYYQDQVVTYVGGTFVLDVATIAAGTRPNRAKGWTRLSETLTDVESEKVSTSDLSGFATNTSSSIVDNGDETSRVRHHFIRCVVSSGIGGVQLYVMKFPRPIITQARPIIAVHPQDAGSGFMFLQFTPTISGNQCTGYVATVLNAAGAGTYEFAVTVKEMIDQVTI